MFHIKCAIIPGFQTSTLLHITTLPHATFSAAPVSGQHQCNTTSVEDLNVRKKAKSQVDRFLAASTYIGINQKNMQHGLHDLDCVQCRVWSRLLNEEAMKHGLKEGNV